MNQVIEALHCYYAHFKDKGCSEYGKRRNAVIEMRFKDESVAVQVAKNIPGAMYNDKESLDRKYLVRVYLPSKEANVFMRWLKAPKGTRYDKIEQLVKWEEEGFKCGVILGKS